MIKIAIVDDEAIYRNTLFEFAEKFASQKELEFKISLFDNGLKFLDNYKGEFDIVFMDVKMPIMDGIETAKRMRKTDESVRLILVTNFAQYAINGYEVGAMDFILKPLSYGSFSTRLERAIRSIDKEKTSVCIKLDDGSMKALTAREILYLEVDNNMITYHTSRGDFVTKGALKCAEEELNGSGFGRCNNCYLVNLRYVSGVNNNMVLMDNGEQVAISRPRKKDFIKALTMYVGGGSR